MLGLGVNGMSGGALVDSWLGVGIESRVALGPSGWLGIGGSAQYHLATRVGGAPGISLWVTIAIRLSELWRLRLNGAADAVFGFAHEMDPVWRLRPGVGIERVF